MRIRVVVAIGLATLFAEPGFAAEWVNIGAAQSGGVIYADASSKQTLPGSVRMWFKNDLSRDRTAADREVKTLYSFHCEQRNSQVLSAIRYRPDGSVSYSNSTPENQYLYSPVAPDTVGEMMLDFACGK